MPSTPRTAADAVARAGGAGLLLAALGVAVGYVNALPVPVALRVALMPVAALLEALLLVALVRVLAAWRPVPLPSLPAVDDQGRPVGRVALVPQPDADDRGPVRAVRRAAALGRPLLRWVLLELLVTAVAIALVIPFTYARLAENAEPGDVLTGSQALAVYVPVQLVATLLLAFVALVPQRLGVEGDPRVLVAAAHSVRVARTAFGVIFGTGLVLGAPGLATAVVRAYERPAWAAVAAALVAVPLRLFGVALLTEVYLRGPRLDVPAEFGSRPAR